ncbi:MAG: hypothetical protein IT426_20940 [Pirellulales bacterium]|nr:hypothetical protein [Pirellulales bacterium]
MKKTVKKTPVTESAIMKRINRKLNSADWPKYLKKTREGTTERDNIGKYYVLDNRNTVVDFHVNLESFARDLKVLADDEEIADECP